MWRKVTELASDIGETWLSIGGFLIGILIGGLILAVSVKGARKRDGENDPFAEWDEEPDEMQEDTQDIQKLEDDLQND